MVEPDRNNFPNLLQLVKNYLKQKTGESQPYVQHLHRLDRVTSGLILFTKQKQHLRYLSEQFAQRSVSKQYFALTDKAPEQLSGVLEHWHRKEKKKAVLVPEGTPFAEKAKLDYTVKSLGSYYLWNINLYTGKYHQIRVQLANLGCPIIGDALYDSTTNYQTNSIALHAAQLTVQHPVTKQQMVFTSQVDFI